MKNQENQILDMGDFMKKHAIAFFALLFAAISIGFMACSNDDDDGATVVNSASNDTITKDAAIGSIVTVSETEYYVIKNTYLSPSISANYAAREATSEIAADVSDSISDKDAKASVKKFAGADYIDTYLGQEANLTEYLLLWNVDNVKTVQKTTSAKNIASLEDKFPVYQYDKDSDSYKKIAELTQTWTSEFLIGNYLDKLKTEEKDRADVFNAMTETEIRSYDPDQITVTTNNNLYGSDVSKKINVTITYNRDSDGYLNFNNVHYHKQYLKYKLVNGKEKYSYFYQINPAVEPVSTMYNLSGHYQLYKYEYTDSSKGKPYFIINAQGDGEIVGSTDPADYKNSIQFYSNKIKAQFGKSETSEGYKLIQVTFSGYNLSQNVTVKITTANGEETKTKDGNAKYTFKEAIETFLSDYIKIAETEEKDGSEYLTKLYTKASFANGAYYNKDFIIVPASVNESGDLVLDYESVINNYADILVDVLTGNYAKADTFPKSE